MKKVLFFSLMASVVFGVVADSAFARKEYNDAWNEHYVKEAKNDKLKTASDEAKCNVCHIQGANKKEKNPYGAEAAKVIKKEDFPKDRLKTDPAGYKKDIEAAFKKIEDLKGKDGKTFAEKIKAGVLPGGDKDGK